MELCGIQIAVGEVDPVVADYANLLGRAPQASTRGVNFTLHRGCVEIVAGSPGLAALHVGDEAANGPRTEAIHGVSLQINKMAVSPPVDELQDDEVIGIDHIVVHSPNLERAIASWRDRIGLRLALDRNFPERGLRILFFRSGGMTLEVVGQLQSDVSTDEPDRLWGIAYTVRDLGAFRTRLLARGIDVSEARRGNKRGTVVATVRSASAGIPTLLIAPEKPAASDTAQRAKTESTDDTDGMVPTRRGKS